MADRPPPPKSYVPLSVLDEPLEVPPRPPVTVALEEGGEGGKGGEGGEGGGLGRPSRAAADRGDGK